MNVVAVLVAAVAMLLASSASAAIGSATAAPPLYKNCTNLNKKYPHGLGKVGARDHTSGTPVTNFKRSTKLYRLAMSYNRGLDGDKGRHRLREGLGPPQRPGHSSQEPDLPETLAVLGKVLQKSSRPRGEASAC